MGETEKPASKNDRDQDSEPYGIYEGTVVKGWGKEKTSQQRQMSLQLMIDELINVYQVAFGGKLSQEE